MSTANTSNRTALVASVILVAAGVVVVLAGVLLVGVHASKRDGEGFYASGAHPLATPTRALMSDDLDVGTDGADWLFHDGRLATIRVTATGTDQKPIFVGIAGKAEVSAYLDGVAHDRITDLDLDPFSVDRTRRPGTLTPPAPTQKHFWAESASGSGRQAIRWHVRKGSWAVVVMNADGTTGVDTRIGVGAKVPAILWFGIGALAIGAVLLGAGGIGTYRGLRRPARHSVAVSTKPQPSTGGGS